MLIFQLGLHKKKSSWFGTLQIKHNDIDGVIRITIPDGKDKVEVSKTALNILKCIESDLKHTIDIIQKHIDTGCEKVPFIKK